MSQQRRVCISALLVPDQQPVHARPPTVSMWRGDLDALDHHYRRCCCHTTTLAVVVGILEAVSKVAMLIGLLSMSLGERHDPHRWTHDPTFRVVFTTTIVVECTWLLAIGFLFYGFHRENSYFLIPHLIIQGIGIIVYLIYAATFVLINDQHESYAAPVICMVLRAFVEIFFFYAILRCTTYFAQKRECIQSNAVTVPMLDLIYPSYYPVDGFVNPPAYSPSVATVTSTASDHGDYSAPVTIEPLPSRLPVPDYASTVLLSSTRISRSDRASSPPPPYSEDSEDSSSQPSMLGGERRTSTNPKP